MRLLCRYAKFAVSRKVFPSFLLFSVSIGVVWVFSRMWFEDGVVVTEDNIWVRSMELALFSTIGLYGMYCAVRSIMEYKQ